MCPQKKDMAKENKQTKKKTYLYGKFMIQKSWIKFICVKRRPYFDTSEFVGLGAKNF